MSPAEASESQPRLPSEVALDLLAGYRKALVSFNDTGSHEEADLLYIAERIRKLAAALVPGALLSPVLQNVNDALLISEEDRKFEQDMGIVFSGPFLSRRAKRLIRVADALRDDFALGRLGPTRSEPAQSDDQGEPPPLAKWLAWCWSNRRKRTALVILLLLIAAAWCLLTFYPRLSP